MPIVPRNYEEWKHSIAVECGMPLTPEYVQQRITALNDMGDYHTQKYIETWGEQLHKRTLEWFETAASELTRQG